MNNNKTKYKSIIIKTGFLFFISFFLISLLAINSGKKDRNEDKGRIMDRDRGKLSREKNFRHPGFGIEWMGPPEEVIEELDTNDDQEISKEEVEAKFQNIFKIIDKNNDDKISQSEFVKEKINKTKILTEFKYQIFSKNDEKRASEKAIDSFGNLDNNNDNSLSFDELFFMPKIDKFVQMLDQNNDEKISLEELRRFSNLRFRNNNNKRKRN